MLEDNSRESKLDKTGDFDIPKPPWYLMIPSTAWKKILSLGLLFMIHTVSSHRLIYSLKQHLPL